jgi:hypothetical protein
MISSDFREWDFDKIDEAFGTMQTFQSIDTNPKKYNF